MRLIAQSVSPAQQASTVVFWLGIIVMIVVVCGVTALWLRRKLRAEEAESDDVSDAAGTGFALSDLRELHRRGELSDAEFEQARRRLIARTKAAMAQESDAEPEDATFTVEEVPDEDDNGPRGGRGSGSS